MANSINSTPEAYDDDNNEQSMSVEEVLMSESDILAGLLEAGRGRDSTENYKLIKIERHGKRLFEFRIRPLSEEESQRCYKAATRYALTKPGQPKREIETNRSLFRSQVIYAATVNDDRAKTWDNKEAQQKFNVLTGVELIDAVLFAGEKSRIMDEIDDLSGYNEDMEELAQD